MNAVDRKALRRSRLKLLLIALVFAAPIIAAAVLTVSGWQPDGKGHGQAIAPQRNFVAEPVPVTLADGSAYPWRDSQPRLTLVALAGPGCAEQCVAVLTRMAAARITLNNQAARLRLLYLGTPPADAGKNGMAAYWQLGTDATARLARYRPASPDSVSALLVESNGTALAFYPPGFDPSGLRQDLQKVIH
jgi:cytochrome oxidase Cu insertion factor (SCO1/SenC/PrrC family)